jgi:thiol-disulfide isomerase/thioredoxin
VRSRSSHSGLCRRRQWPAPRFRAKTTAGNQLNNESLKGKVVLFEFWTTWCKYGEGEAELVEDGAKQFADQGLIVLAVDVLEPDQRVKKYLADHPRSVPNRFPQRHQHLAAMYNAQSDPNQKRKNQRKEKPKNQKQRKEEQEPEHFIPLNAEGGMLTAHS